MKRCNSIGIVETPSNIKKLSKYTKKPIYYFPDFISTEKNNVSLNIAFTIDEIKKIACNRTIISMIGTIQKRKNIINLIDAASKLQNNVFVFIYGKLSSSDFSNTEIDKIRHGLPPNVIIYDRFIETESDINALYELTDIVWNAYLNWNFTSNALSKASYFKKAIISSNGSYISEICNKYTIGVTVNEDDIESIKSGILKCPTIIDNDNFLEFNKLNSIESLKYSLEQLIFSTKNSVHDE
ncbi:glycosyltransferase [Providencia rettgeri]